MTEADSSSTSTPKISIWRSSNLAGVIASMLLSVLSLYLAYLFTRADYNDEQSGLVSLLLGVTVLVGVVTTLLTAAIADEYDHKKSDMRITLVLIAFSLWVLIYTLPIRTIAKSGTLQWSYGGIERDSYNLAMVALGLIGLFHLGCLACLFWEKQPESAVSAAESESDDAALVADEAYETPEVPPFDQHV